MGSKKRSASKAKQEPAPKLSNKEKSIEKTAVELKEELSTSDSDSNSSSSSSSDSDSDSSKSDKATTSGKTDADSEKKSDDSKSHNSSHKRARDSERGESAGSVKKTKAEQNGNESESSSRTESPDISGTKSSSAISAGEDVLKPGQRNHFSRIDRSRVSFEDWELTDNTYKGAAGTWGEMANDRLSKVRGKDFTKNKNKMKRGSYRGGSINLNSGSYKFQD